MLHCPICDTEKKEEDFLKIYFSSFNNQEYKLYHCLNCEILFWWPLKMEKKLYEESDEYTILSLPINTNLESRHKIFFKYVPLKTGDLLDIGCGDGRFLEEAKKLGFNVFGIDLNKISINYCKKRNLENTFHMSLEEFFEFAKKKNLNFDIITFFEVLEHQDDPIGFLRKAKELLKPSGFLIGTVPNRDRFILFKETQGRENFDFPPHHFFWFNKNSLTFLFRKEGFTDIEIFVESYNFKEMIASIERIITGKIGLNIRKFLKKIILSSNNQHFFKNRREKFKSQLVLYFLRTMQKIRDIIFFIPSIFLWLTLKLIILKNKDKGSILYFQIYKSS